MTMERVLQMPPSRFGLPLRCEVAVGLGNGNPMRQRGSSGLMADFIRCSYQGLSVY